MYNLRNSTWSHKTYKQPTRFLSLTCPLETPTDPPKVEYYIPDYEIELSRQHCPKKSQGEKILSQKARTPSSHDKHAMNETKKPQPLLLNKS